MGIAVDVVGAEHAEQLLAHPQRQNPQRRCAEVAKQWSQPVEEVDPPQAVDAQVHAHQAGDRPRGADTGLPGRLEYPPEQVRGHTADQVEAEKHPAAQGYLQGKAEDKQEHHIAQQVIAAAVQEHRPKQALPGELGRHEAKAIIADAIAGRFGGGAGGLPGGIGQIV